MIHQVVSEIWVFRMGSTILEYPVYGSGNTAFFHDLIQNY